MTFYSFIWNLSKSAGICSSDPDPDTEPPILNGRIRNRSNSVPDANESIAGASGDVHEAFESISASIRRICVDNIYCMYVSIG